MRMRLLWATLVLAGCASRATDRGALLPNITGHWGAAPSPLALELTLAMSGSYVTGTGVLSRGSVASEHLAVTGQYSGGVFTLQLISHDNVVARYAGRLTPEGTMQGVLTDAAGPTDTLVLVRLPPGVGPRQSVPRP